MPSKILIIDDEEELVELTQHLLNNAGYQVITGTSGDDTITLAQQHSPQLIILDLILQRKNGFEICHELKSDPKTQSILILITTGQILSKETLQQYAELKKPDDILQKPFEIEDLLTKVKNLLNRK